MSNLPVRKQLSILKRIWGGDNDGYVFLPWLPGHLKTREERLKNWKEVCFKWPQEESKIRAHLEKHQDDDLFFCPNLFDQPHRNKEVISLNQHALYADLDEVDPREVPGEYRPTIAWQTSEGRFQAVWLLGQYETGLTDEGAENHRLTAHLGADKTGWDTTQVLRVPGRRNHKPDRNGEQGVLLWDTGPWYSSTEDFEDLPEIEVAADLEMEVGEALLDDIDRKEVWRRVRMKVSTRCRDYMGIRSTAVARDAASDLGEGMSGLMWYVERELADAGCNSAEIIALVRPMPWNKFAGRRDELVRLKSEAAKAIRESRRGEDTSSGALESAVSDVEDVSVSLDDFMSASRPRPRWLVDRIWGEGTVGFIAGAPKSYKSWLGLDMALSVATGSPFLGTFATRQGKVLYVQEEDSDIQVFDRVGKVFWGKPKEMHPHGYMDVEVNGEGRKCVVWKPPQGERLMRLVVRKGLDLTSTEWQGYLAEQCEEHEYDLVIIDTLGTTSGDTDTDKSREVNKALKPLKVLAETYGCAIAVVHHFSKSGSGKEGQGMRGGHKMLGSVALHAWVETGVYVSEKTLARDKVYRVEVERESKSAQDLRFGVEIPLMGKGALVENAEGELVGTSGWSPVVDFSRRTVEDEGSDSAGNEGARSNGRGPGRGGKMPSWKKTTTIMKGAGMTAENRAKPLAYILNNQLENSISRTALDNQLKSAMDAGSVARVGAGGRDDEYRYWVCR